MFADLPSPSSNPQLPQAATLAAAKRPHDAVDEDNSQNKRPAPSMTNQKHELHTFSIFFSYPSYACISVLADTLFYFPFCSRCSRAARICRRTQRRAGRNAGLARHSGCVPRRNPALARFHVSSGDCKTLLIFLAMWSAEEYT